MREEKKDEERRKQRQEKQIREKSQNGLRRVNVLRTQTPSKFEMRERAKGKECE